MAGLGASLQCRGSGGSDDRKVPGKAPKLNAEQKAQFAEVLEQGPTPAVHGVARWRLKDLVGWVWEEFRVTLREQSMSRILRELTTGSGHVLNTDWAAF